MIDSGFVVPSLMLVALATWLPAVAFVVSMIFLRPYPYRTAVLSIAAVSASLLAAVWLLVRHWHMTTPIQYSFRWVASGDFTIPFGFLLDPVSLLMLTVVAGYLLLVQVYSLATWPGSGIRAATMRSCPCSPGP
jgi:NADH-quinone oxidoreductase subunit L